MFGFLAPLLGGIVKGITGFFERKQEIKVAKHKAKVDYIRMKAASQAKILETNANADLESIRNQRTSIKDEILMLIIFAPFVGSFIPGVQPYVKQGFDNLSQLPVWYQVSVIGIIVSVFGLRFMINRFFGGKKK